MALQYDPRQVVLNLLQLRAVVFMNKPSIEPERVYSGVLHHKKGAMLFSYDPTDLKEIYEEIKEVGGKEEEWTPIHLKVFAKKTGNKFIIVDEHGIEMLSHLSEEARKVAQITVDLLNKQSANLSGKDPIEKAVLEDLRFISDFFAKEVEKLPGWAGKISREKAEELLEGKAQGTYLLRRGDEATDIMLKMLFDEKAEPFLYLIVTCLLEEGQLGEKLLIESGGWFVYNDVPNLDYYLDRKFPSLEALINSIEPLKHPLQGL